MRHSVIFPGNIFAEGLSLRFIFITLSEYRVIALGVEHGAEGGGDVGKGSALAELKHRLLLQNEEDVELDGSFFPAVFLTELPQTERARARSLQVLREGRRRSIRSAWLPVKPDPIKSELRELLRVRIFCLNTLNGTLSWHLHL